MSNTGSLILDLAKKQLTESQHKQIVERVPIYSSLACNGLYFGEYHEPFLETPEHSHPQHEIVTLHFQEPTPVEWAIDGRTQKTLMPNSSVCLFPAHTLHRAQCSTASHFSLVTLDLAQIASVAYEDMGDRTELLPQVNVFDPVVHHIEQLLQLELQGNRFGNSVYVDSLATALSIHLIRQYANQPLKQREFSAGLSPYQLQNVLEYIQAHLSENITLDAIAQVAGMSRYHFIRRFKRTMHESPYQYLIGQRLEKAKQLLKSQLAIAEIAVACGFADQSHLTKHFKQRIGVTPQVFRKTT
ncbi:MAG: helix-turn-helix domain-containing protein [Leptolyngbya sp. BL-A-14]